MMHQNPLSLSALLRWITSACREGQAREFTSTRNQLHRRQCKPFVATQLLPLRAPSGGRRLAAARTGVSDCAGFAPN